LRVWVKKKRLDGEKLFRKKRGGSIKEGDESWPFWEQRFEETKVSPGRHSKKREKKKKKVSNSVSAREVKSSRKESRKYQKKKGGVCLNKRRTIPKRRGSQPSRNQPLVGARIGRKLETAIQQKKNKKAQRVQLS